MIYEEKCPVHGLPYVSMPRQAEEDDDCFWVAKCPLSSCMQGIIRPRPIDYFGDVSPLKSQLARNRGDLHG